MIDLCQINRQYGGGKQPVVTALDQFSLQIPNGEMIAIMGPSGSGKSTLLNIIGLLDRPSRGKYILNGTSVQTLNTQQRAKLRNGCFGFVLQDFAVLENATVYQNVAIPLSYAEGKISRAEKKERVFQVLKHLGIENKIDVPTENLSGGQRQRVAIARALINNPEIILADEPTGALDQRSGMEVLDLLKNINREGKTVLIVTHDPTVARRCDRIVYLLDGKIERIEPLK